MKKAGVGLLVSAIAISGAFAWLKSSDTASKTNQLKVGGAKIIFDNQLDSVSLVDNSAIPMTKANAIANLTAYTFDIKNEGEVHLDYTISVDGDSYLNTFDAGKVNVLIAPIADGASAEEIKTALTSATIQRLSSGVSLTSSNLQAGTHQRYALIAFVDRNTKLAEYTGKEVSFKLRVDAVQHNVLNAENYETLTKSQINTTVTVGGESKNVDVYNIEGESKTDLLNKLQASGLTDTADVDAIIEVKGEEYDGINSTATFDVSSIANPGDEVVILHYNETTQEWEYIGRETVGDDNTVSGDFTSYSPVAFIVYKPDGSIVQKEFDSETGVLIKEIEIKSNGSSYETEYDSNGEITSTEEHVVRNFPLNFSFIPESTQTATVSVRIETYYRGYSDGIYNSYSYDKDFKMIGEPNEPCEGELYKVNYIELNEQYREPLRIEMTLVDGEWKQTYKNLNEYYEDNWTTKHEISERLIAEAGYQYQYNEWYYDINSNVIKDISRGDNYISIGEYYEGTNNIKTTYIKTIYENGTYHISTVLYANDSTRTKVSSIDEDYSADDVLTESVTTSYDEDGNKLELTKVYTNGVLTENRDWKYDGDSWTVIVRDNTQYYENGNLKQKYYWIKNEDSTTIEKDMQYHEDGSYWFGIYRENGVQVGTISEDGTITRS